MTGCYAAKAAGKILDCESCPGAIVCVVRRRAYGTRLQCRWVLNDSGFYETECGEAFVLEAATPAENGMKFCPYCGRRLREGAR